VDWLKGIRKVLVSALLTAVMAVSTGASAAGPAVLYQLYINPERFGVVVFPKEGMPPELHRFLGSLDFKPVDSGEAVMRFGEKRENMTYMMPREVQEKHGIKKFIILQALAGNGGLMVGIYEQEYGLTLPPKVFDLETVKQNIPKTLDMFRQQEGRKKTELPRGNRRETSQGSGNDHLTGGVLRYAVL